MDFEYHNEDQGIDDFQWDIPVRKDDAPVNTPGMIAPPLFKETLNLDMTETRQFSSGSSQRRKTYQVALWSWLALLVDGLLMFSAVCALSVTTSVILEMKTRVVLQQLLTQSSGLFFLAALWIVYSVSFRFFLGGTLGEWGFDLRVGLPTERMKGSYLFKILLRGICVALPGMQILSLVSKVIGKDLVGSISGVKIYSLR